MPTSPEPETSEDLGSDYEPDGPPGVISKGIGEAGNIGMNPDF